MLVTFLALSAVITIAVAIVLWIITTQRRLVVLDDTVSDLMGQIGAQLESSFNALTDLLYVTTDYDRLESEALMEEIRSRSNAITAKSIPSDIVSQELMISEAMARIAIVAEQYPELKADKTYSQTMNSIEASEKLVRTGRLIYNDSVAKLNREIRVFPVSMVAGLFGFEQRPHLEE